MYIMLLDALLPEYQFNERHRILIHAPPERALEAVKQAMPGEMSLVRTLFTVRSYDPERRRPRVICRRSLRQVGRSVAQARATVVGALQRGRGRHVEEEQK